jgi:uncharacterized protein involved in exopolysaccharide biosynthesis
MSDEHNLQMDERNTITRIERRNIWIWAIALLVLFGAVGAIASRAVYKNKMTLSIDTMTE